MNTRSYRIAIYLMKLNLEHVPVQVCIVELFESLFSCRPFLEKNLCVEAQALLVDPVHIELLDYAELTKERVDFSDSDVRRQVDYNNNRRLIAGLFVFSLQTFSFKRLLWLAGFL